MLHEVPIPTKVTARNFSTKFLQQLLIYNNHTNTYQPANVYYHANAYNPSSVYQPSNSYQTANPYQYVNIQNQAKTHQPADPYQPITAAYGSPPAQTHSVIEDRELVHAEDDDYGIDTNILNDELTHEVIAPYTGVWRMHENTMAHEAMVEPMEDNRLPLSR